MKHNMIYKTLRWMAAASLCLAAAACSKDDIVPESAPQQGITPTKFIFNVTRGGYEGDAETRAPKSGWEEGDVVYFGVQGALNNTATYTGGSWAVKMNSPIPENYDFFVGFYAERATVNADGNLEIGHGDVAFTTEGNYEVDEDGVATITLNLNQHPQGRMTFTGVGKGKELVVEGMEHVSLCNISTTYLSYKKEPITLTGEDDGTVTLYGKPTSDIVSGTDITLKVKYDGKLYTKTFANKAFKPNSNITLAAPSVTGGWKDASTVPVTGVTLNKTVLELYTGGSETLKATVAPANATNKKVTWTSSKPTVATVDANGKVTAKSIGMADITVTTKDGGYTATCRVGVVRRPAGDVSVTGVTLNKTTLKLGKGTSETLTATIAPTNATNKKVTWTSSNPAVATVDASGKVTGVANGTATITVTTEDGGHTATCAVEVADTKNGNHDPYTIETLTW